MNKSERHVLDEEDLAHKNVSFKVKDKQGIETTGFGYRLFRIQYGYQHTDVREKFPLRYGDTIWNIEPSKISKIIGFTEIKDQLSISLTTHDGREYSGFLPEYDGLYFGGYTELSFFQILCTKLDSISFLITNENKSDWPVAPR
jgi:hypothetical protein